MQIVRNSCRAEEETAIATRQRTTSPRLLSSIHGKCLSLCLIMRQQTTEDDWEVVTAPPHPAIRGCFVNINGLTREKPTKVA